MSRKRNKKEYLPFLNLELNDFDLKENGLVSDMFESKKKSFNCAFEYTVDKRKLNNEKVRMLNEFEHKIMNLLSDVMDICEELKMEVTKE